MNARPNEKKGVLTEAAPGIYTIETHYLQRDRFAGCYLLEDSGEAAIIETNTNYGVPGILAGLAEVGLKREQVKYVIITHIHLDHAGGAGELLRHLPNAQLLLHARGKRHLIDPEKLIESVKLVYGEEKYHEFYGDVLPVPKNRVSIGEDNQVITVGKRDLLILETPGHAKHHIVLFDRQTGSLFSGDAFGIAYPRFAPQGERFVFASTSPTQFEPETALMTYDKIMGLKPARILHTHYGSNEQVDSAYRQLVDWIHFSMDIADRRYGQGLRDEALFSALRDDLYTRFAEKIHGPGASLSPEEREFLFLDADLNAKGMAHTIQVKAGS